MSTHNPKHQTLFEAIRAIKLNPNNMVNTSTKKKKTRTIHGETAHTLSICLRESDIKVVDQWCETLQINRCDLLRVALDFISGEFELPKIPNLWKLSPKHRSAAATRFNMKKANDDSTSDTASS